MMDVFFWTTSRVVFANISSQKNELLNAPYGTADFDVDANNLNKALNTTNIELEELICPCL